ncbi:MAG: 50S ribosomal protein L11 methyltransferase [Sphingobium sp.]
MTDTWKVTLPCTRAEAEALTEDSNALAALPHSADNPPVVMSSELETDNAAAWQIEAFFEGKPKSAAVKMLHALLPSAARARPKLEKLPDEDWVSLSQQGMNPVIAGRFQVRNHADDALAADKYSLLIPAGRAFGTGQHETTSGCLAMLDRCRSIGARFGNIADIGTGTGLLAFAALHLWPGAYATASDIDPASVEVTRDNARLNHVSLGQGLGQVAVWQAAGVNHDGIMARAPYDLMIANILAGPLIELAPSLCALLEPGGTMILAGLLDEQRDRVLAAYRHQGMRLADGIDNGHWPTLRLRKRPAIGWKRPRRWASEDVGEAPGFGSW